MKELINKSSGFNRIEFWAVSTLFVFALFIYITDGLNGSSGLNSTPYRARFEQANVRFYFYYNYFVPQLVRYIFLFAAFLYLNFILVPKLLIKEALTKNVFIVIAIFLLAGVLFGVTDTYLKGYLYASGKGREEVDQAIFQISFLYTFRLLWTLAIYTLIKYVAIYLLTESEVIYAKFKFITKEGIVAFVIWMIALFLLITLEAETPIIVGWMLLVPSAIALYLYSFYRLIPRSLGKRYYFGSYVLKCVFVLAIAFIPVSLFFLLFFHDDETAFTFSFFNTVFQLFITVPLTWTLYKRKMKGNEEVVVLKKELGRSNASFDFLRSQINPHFLFNALNTIYGTAIQEKAERTGEGIERLGNMMRFMLQENMQDKISLLREIEYLNNYISLQRLRTDPNPIIKIEAHIEEDVHAVQIAPMLLIPFVENAFKHGISFREPSHIKVSLEMRDKTLYFDVYNSKHERPENDPEKNKSGIGLNNVKQRLQLLYPSKHELIIRETGKEFFVHLTIHLS